jgi:hypothetical protein
VSTCNESPQKQQIHLQKLNTKKPKRIDAGTEKLENVKEKESKIKGKKGKRSN